MTAPHVFQPRAKGSQCSVCGGWADASYHNYELFSDADKERERVKALEAAEHMTAILRTSMGDVSKIAGQIERDSPLFYGSGVNPILF